GALFGAGHGGAVAAAGDGMAERLCAGGDDRVAGHRGDRDGGVVDDPVDDHLLDVGFDLDRVEGDLGHLPGQLALVRQVLVGAVDADVVLSGGAVSWWGGGAGGRAGGWSVCAPRSWARARGRWTVAAAAASSGSPAASARAIAERS